MRRCSTCATPAASTATTIASAQMYAVRRVTFAACGPMFAWARPGPSDGATGSPSVVEPVLAGPSATVSGSGSGRTCAPAGPGHARLTLEKHWGRDGLVDSHAVDHTLQEAFEILPLRGAELLQRIEEIRLRGAWGSAEEALAGGGEPERGAAGVLGRDGTDHQATLGETVHHHRDRACVGEGSPGELGHRAHRPLRQAFEDEELRRAQPEARLGGAVGEPKGPHQPSQRPEGPGGRRGEFHGNPSNNTVRPFRQLAP